MALIRVATNADNRSEIVQLVNIYRGEIVDVTLDSMIVQIVGARTAWIRSSICSTTSASSRWCAPAP
jgi:acetolactate synthase small subunit